MSTLLLARHGNNFAPGDKVRWIGRSSDLKLVESGLRQAEAAAAALARHRIMPTAIYCASLERTRHFAAIIADRLQSVAPIIDDRLLELDYGAWEGLSNDEISAQGPAQAAALARWADQDDWPEAAGWASHKSEILAALDAFIAERLTSDATILIVSSNGILRFLPRLLLAKADHLPSFRMRTGHLGRITKHESGNRLGFWDQGPDSWIID